MNVFLVRFPPPARPPLSKPFTLSYRPNVLNYEDDAWMMNHECGFMMPVMCTHIFLTAEMLRCKFYGIDAILSGSCAVLSCPTFSWCAVPFVSSVPIKVVIAWNAFLYLWVTFMLPKWIERRTQLAWYPDEVIYLRTKSQCDNFLSGYLVER